MNRRRAYLVIAGSLVVGWATAAWAANKDPMNIEDGALDEIHLKDASGKIMAEFTHMKHSGMGIGGGDYVKFLSDDTRDVGRDIAKFLTKWATGKDLHKD